MGHLLDVTVVSWPRYAHRGQTRILVVGSMVVLILARFVVLFVSLYLLMYFLVGAVKKRWKLCRVRGVCVSFSSGMMG